MKYELVLIREDGDDRVIKNNLTYEEAVKYFEEMDDVYYREQEEK